MLLQPVAWPSVHHQEIHNSGTSISELKTQTKLSLIINLNFYCCLWSCNISSIIQIILPSAKSKWSDGTCSLLIDKLLSSSGKALLNWPSSIKQCPKFFNATTTTIQSQFDKQIPLQLYSVNSSNTFYT